MGKITRRSMLGGVTGAIAAASLPGQSVSGQQDPTHFGLADSGVIASTETPRTEGARTAWFQEAKFGMFITWGPYSLVNVIPSWTIMDPNGGMEKAAMPPGGITEEEYVALPKRFNPEKFNADEIVELARLSGQRYITFVIKHHDGFCMYDSLYTNYKITKTPYGKDVTKQLADACHKDGMALAFYYSPPDMNHPAFRDTSKPAYTNWLGEPARPEWPIYLEYMRLQLTELLTRYGKIVTLWFDGIHQQPEKLDGRRFMKLIQELSPDTLINDRLGVGGYDFVTPENFVPNRIPIKGGGQMTRKDPNNSSIPKPDDFQLWESCMAINNKNWSYNANDPKFMSAQDIIRTLIECASKGGNLNLGVGPKPDGTIQVELRERLLATGEWLRVNGDAIYGTTYGPIQGLKFARTTSKGKKVYVHVLDWPSAAMVLPSFGKKVIYVTLLANNQRLKFRQDTGSITIELPKDALDPAASVVVLETT